LKGEDVVVSVPH